MKILERKGEDLEIEVKIESDKKKGPTGPFIMLGP